MNEPIVCPGVNNSARSCGVAGDLQLSSQVFPYGAPVCLDKGCTMTAFIISSQDTSDSSVGVECQDPNMGGRTSSENETVRPIVSTAIDTMYRMLNVVRFVIHRSTSTILHQMLPLAPIRWLKRHSSTHSMSSSNRTTGTAIVCPTTNECRNIL